MHLRSLSRLLLCGLLLLTAHTASADWPQFRGPLASGYAPDADPPAVWAESGPASKNLRWKIELPGLGLSSPVVWGDRIYLTATIPAEKSAAAEKSATAPLEDAHQHEHTEDKHEHEHEHTPDDGAHDNMAPQREHRFVVLAVERESGEIAWQTTVRTARPHEGTHVTGSWASASPVTDGEYLYAFFGSQGIYALNLDGENEGKVAWEKDLGKMTVRHEHGEGASPAVYGEVLAVNWDHQGDSFVVALNKRTGEELWRAARDEITSWSTPLIVTPEDQESGAGKPQLVVSATKAVRSYDLATGKVLWQASGLSRNVVASPVASDGIVYAMNSYDWQALLAIRLDAATRLGGDVTEKAEAIAWTRSRDTSYVPSPLLGDGLLCFVKHLQAIFTCVDPLDGSKIFGPARLPGLRMIYASPVLAGGKIYIVGRDGSTVILTREDFALLSVNQLDDQFSASPAVDVDSLYLRGDKYLYRLAEPTSKVQPAQASKPEDAATGLE